MFEGTYGAASASKEGSRCGVTCREYGSWLPAEVGHVPSRQLLAEVGHVLSRQLLAEVGHVLSRQLLSVRRDGLLLLSRLGLTSFSGVRAPSIHRSRYLGASCLGMPASAWFRRSDEIAVVCRRRAASRGHAEGMEIAMIESRA
jgi:hypothetical protein